MSEPIEDKVAKLEAKIEHMKSVLKMARRCLLDHLPDHGYPSLSEKELYAKIDDILYGNEEE